MAQKIAKLNILKLHKKCPKDCFLLRTTSKSRDVGQKQWEEYFSGFGKNVFRKFANSIFFDHKIFSTAEKNRKLKTVAPYKLLKTMRAGVIILGPLLSRFKKAKVSLPGGCAIGTRPVDIHLYALKKLGAKIKIKNGYIFAYAKNGLIIDNNNKKVFRLYNGKVINKDKKKINAFEFDQIDFNLADYSSSTIVVPKIQEVNSRILLSCSTLLNLNDWLYLIMNSCHRNKIQYL